MSPSDAKIRAGFRLALIVLVLTGLASGIALVLLSRASDVQAEYARTQASGGDSRMALHEPVSESAWIVTIFVVVGTVLALLVVIYARSTSLKAILERDEARAELVRENELLEEHVRQRTAQLEAGTIRLASQEERLRLALEAGRMGTWDWDLKTNRMMWSDDYALLLGIEPQSFEDGFEPFVRHVLLQDGIELVNALMHARQTPGEFSHEYRIRRELHEFRWVMIFGRTEMDGIQPQRMIGLVMDVTVRKNAEIQLRRALDRLKDLTRHLQQVREEERTRIAREIHDELGQSLTGIKMEVVFSRNRSLKAGPELPADFWEQKCDILSGMIDDTIRTVRRIASELRPGVLDELGLGAAVEWLANDFARRSEVHCQTLAEDIPLPGEVATAVFRICQEALTNVARHAQATQVRVELQRRNGSLLLRVQDNGRGFDRQTTGAKKTLGLLGMKERASLAGGRLALDSSPDRGTIVELTLPLGNDT